jgi:hypothetical protein
LLYPQFLDPAESHRQGIPPWHVSASYTRFWSRRRCSAGHGYGIVVFIAYPATLQAVVLLCSFFIWPWAYHDTFFSLNSAAEGLTSAQGTPSRTCTHNLHHNKHYISATSLTRAAHYLKLPTIFVTALPSRTSPSINGTIIVILRCPCLIVAKLHVLDFIP